MNERAAGGESSFVLDGKVRAERSSPQARSIKRLRVSVDKLWAVPATAARALLGHGRTMHVTHQTLAEALGTVRDIVIQRLKRAELVATAALRQLSNGDTEPVSKPRRSRSLIQVTARIDSDFYSAFMPARSRRSLKEAP